MRTASVVRKSATSSRFSGSPTSSRGVPACTGPSLCCSTRSTRPFEGAVTIASDVFLPPVAGRMRVAWAASMERRAETCAASAAARSRARARALKSALSTASDAIALESCQFLHALQFMLGLVAGYPRTFHGCLGLGARRSGHSHPRVGFCARTHIEQAWRTTEPCVPAPGLR